LNNRNKSIILPSRSKIQLPGRLKYFAFVVLQSAKYITRFSVFKINTDLTIFFLILEISKIKLILPDKTCTVQNLLYSKKMRNAHNQKGKDTKLQKVL